MKPLTVNAFLGANLAADALLLPEGVGVESLNHEPGFGDMRPWNQPSSAVATIPASPQRLTIARYWQPDNDQEGTYWLSFPQVVNIVTGFEADDTTGRLYLTGSGTPKWTNASIGISGGPPYPQSFRELGVPAPTTALTATLAVNGSTGEDVGTLWAYTFVNDLGWESAPGPASNTILAKPGATFNLSGFDTPPSGNYGINRIRLYRFVTGEGQAGAYFFIREWSIGATPTNPIDDARAQAPDPISTTGWRPCPGIPGGGSTNLTEATAFGMVKLWNGMHAVLTGKSMRICEPYKPYAWPLDYEVAIADEPVAIAVWGQRALILTKGDHVLVAGSSPDSMDDEPAKINRPCVSARSVVEFNEGADARGILWASEQGLCWLGDGGFRMLTEGLLTREQWQALKPSTIVATRYKGFYLGFYTVSGVRRGFLIDPKNPTGLYFLSDGYHAVHRDPLTDTVYVLDGANVRRWNGGTAMTATFRSKVFRLPGPMNLGCVEVIAKGYPVTVKVWADGVLKLDRAIQNDTPVRMSGGWEAEEIQVEAASAHRVIAVRLAQSVADLLQT